MCNKYLGENQVILSYTILQPKSNEKVLYFPALIDYSNARICLPVVWRTNINSFVYTKTRRQHKIEARCPVILILAYASEMTIISQLNAYAF